MKRSHATNKVFCPFPRLTTVKDYIVDRLHYLIRGEGLAYKWHILLVKKGIMVNSSCHKNNGCTVEKLSCDKLLKQLDTGHVRHINIRDYYIVVMVRNHLKGFTAVSSRLDEKIFPR